MGLEYSLVDWRSLGAFERLASHDIVLWHFSHYSADEMRFARPILAALKLRGCTVFPDAADADHFDDKVAQAYLLQALGLDTPKNYTLHSRKAVDDWIEDVGVFPVVAKLRAGSGSSNVQLVKSKEQLSAYAKRMFGPGFRSRPGALFKIKSNLSSSRSMTDIMKRLRRAPEFLFSWLNAGNLPRESGYVYLQEFIPGVDYDLKIVVVGGKLSYICRAVRAGDFRASGGGNLYYDRSMVTPQIVAAAFKAAAALKSDCTGFDMIVDPRDGRAVVLEVSYGFSHTALMAAGEHCDRNGRWSRKPLNAPKEILKTLLYRLEGA
ncbi:ATP-grasp domain-containing protein [Brevundimonas sp.]|uniref:ATP-grasp domain-containing protein n=1 Tax=Brevundimonas sp. TaxID=1871086 RepID=UPI003AF8F254